MNLDRKAIRTYFSKLGMEPAVADIYFALYVHGPQTISALARNSEVERTRIYRLLDKLQASNLVEVEKHYKHEVLKAAPITNLRILINQREQEIKNLADELDLIEQALAHNSLSDPATRVQFYHGAEGIRQMQWNVLRAKTDILSIMDRPMQDVAGTAFFNRWTEKWNEQNLSCRILLSDNFLKQSNTWHEKHPRHIPKQHHSRLLKPEVFPMPYISDIYDDVTSYYNWRGADVFGIEIYNQGIADGQRIFFESLWAQSQPPARDLGSADWISEHPAYSETTVSRQKAT